MWLGIWGKREQESFAIMQNAVFSHSLDLKITMMNPKYLVRTKEMNVLLV